MTNLFAFLSFSGINKEEGNDPNENWELLYEGLYINQYKLILSLPNKPSNGKGNKKIFELKCE